MNIVTIVAVFDTITNMENKDILTSLLLQRQEYYGRQFMS